MQEHPPPLLLNTILNPDYLRLVTAFAEESAKAFGMGAEDAIKLTLACEEIFVYLCRAGRADEAITAEATNGGYYVQVKFLFKAHEFNPRAFNLTAHVSLEDMASFDEMGLLIASRTVDRFSIISSPQQDLELVLIKEKTYPELQDINVPEPKQSKSFTVTLPDPEGLKLLSRLVVAHYPSNLYLTAFGFPGKVVDMVASGEYGAAVALGDSGQIGGGILWRWLGKKTVESFGPYLFNQSNQPVNPELAKELVDSSLGRIAKTDAIGLVHLYSTSELPPGYFESLGSIDLVQADGLTKPWTIYYRQLNEDLGSRVWAHPGLEGFLRSEYKRLFFAREIRPATYEGEQRPPYSVFAPQFDRSNGQITLRPIWDGMDAAENLARHVKVLKAENLLNIFFEIDLAHAWQANLTQALLENHFQPRLILPYAGDADVVVFQYREGT
jgi:anti-sigma regulatory factor (Ser/Thr protein kinase)